MRMKNSNKMHSAGLVIEPKNIATIKRAMENPDREVYHYTIDIHKYYKCKPFATVNVYSAKRSTIDYLFVMFDKRAH